MLFTLRRYDGEVLPKVTFSYKQHVTCDSRATSLVLTRSGIVRLERSTKLGIKVCVNALVGLCLTGIGSKEDQERCNKEFARAEFIGQRLFHLASVEIPFAFPTRVVDVNYFQFGVKVQRR